PLLSAPRLGPHTGQPVPDFALSDQRGTRRTLGSLMGPKGLVLFFNRSVDWGPFCKTQLVGLHGRAQELPKSGMGLSVITYDPVPVLAESAQRRGITFPLLS